MTILTQTKALLTQVLHLQQQADSWTLETPLLGNVAELDSMAVVAVISEIERVFGIHMDDDEINADLFATVGALTAFIEQKLAQK